MLSNIIKDIGMDGATLFPGGVDFEKKFSIGIFKFQLDPKKTKLGHHWSLFAYYQLTPGILDPNKFMVGHSVNHCTCCSLQFISV